MHISFRSVLLALSLIMTVESTCTSTQFIHSLSHRAVKIAGTVLSTITDFGLLGLGTIGAYYIIDGHKDERGVSAATVVLSLGLLYLKKSYALERAVKALHTPTENQTEQTA